MKQNWRTHGSLALLVYVTQLWFYRGYVTDDTWIYARFAQNLARYGELSFNPGHPIHAATSPLWALLAAIGARVGFAPIHVLMALGWVCGAISVLVFSRLVHRLVPHSGLALGVILVFATEVWWVRWSASGMETALGVLWLLLVLDLSWRPPSRVPVLALGLVLGGGFLIRPESLALTATFALALVRQPELRARKILWGALLVVPLLWTAYAWPTFGHLLPATMQAKSTPIGLQWPRFLHNLRVLAGLYLVAAPLATAAWVVGMGRGRWEWRGEDWSEPVWRVWMLLLPAAYLVRDVQVVSRYLELVLPVVLLWSARRWSRSRTLESARWRRGAVALCALQVLVALGLTLGWVAPRSRAFGQSLEAGLGDLAAWIVENTQDQDLVAVYDIGYLGAKCNRPILDLGGLVQPQINALRDHIDDAEILRQGLFLDYGQPTVLVDRDPQPAALDGLVLRGLRLQAVLHRRVANLGLSRPEPVYYTLYRLLPVVEDDAAN